MVEVEGLRARCTEADGRRAESEAAAEALEGRLSEAQAELASAQAELASALRASESSASLAQRRGAALTAACKLVAEFAARRRAAAASDAHADVLRGGCSDDEEEDEGEEEEEKGGGEASLSLPRALARALARAEREGGRLRGLLDALASERGRDADYYNGRIRALEAEAQRGETERAIEREEARAEARAEADAQASAARRELGALRERLGRRDGEIHELNHMLQAWESMREQKDLQINELMRQCSHYEHESHARTRVIHGLQRRLLLSADDAAAAAEGEEVRTLQAAPPVL